MFSLPYRPLVVASQRGLTLGKGMLETKKIPTLVGVGTLSCCSMAMANYMALTLRISFDLRLEALFL